MRHANLRRDAEALWTAALRAVQPEHLVAGRLAPVADGSLHCVPPAAEAAGEFRLDAAGRIVVVGGGKAAAGMAAGVETLLGPDRLARHHVSGLVSVPQGCGRRLERIEVRETRPAGSNLPTEAVVQATREMLALLSRLERHDLAVAVITGGGSALLAAPRAGVTLDEKIAVTSRLSRSGADIATLNAVRRTMSDVKGGGLARACTAGELLVLVLSDVIGDDLDVIASGPCMPPAATVPPGCWTTPSGCRVRHLLIGHNQTAVTAAEAVARSLGYEVVSTTGGPPARAEDVGEWLAATGLDLAAAARRDGRPRVLVDGGEATVTVPTDHGRGGRNQQTVLAAVAGIHRRGLRWPDGLCVASIGTDGEDGPTDAAGGVADADLAAAVDGAGLDVAAALARCDAYPLLAAAGGLVRTGPTGTNVADLRIVLARP